MTKLSVNVNKIATLRNTRELEIPDIARLSRIALDNGAAGITVHPRPDERHIRNYDVDNLANLLQRYPTAELNIEGNPFHGLIDHCRRVRPTQATLVPDSRDAPTSNSGWLLAGMSVGNLDNLAEAIAELQSFGCRVSLFVDPDPAVIPFVVKLGADRVELYTEPFAAAFAMGRGVIETPKYAATGMAAKEAGLGVNGGHDLSLDNLDAFLSAVHDVDEVSIGHALIADALELGMAEAVRRYMAICKAAR